MTRIFALLSSYALPILATALILTATAFGVQTWRISGLQQDKANLRAGLDQAVAANKSNQATIDALVTAAEHNAARYQGAIDRADEAATQIEYLNTQIRSQADDDIEQIESTTDNCARERLPDDIRDRLRYAGGDGNGRGPGSAGAADSASGQSDARL